MFSFIMRHYLIIKLLRHMLFELLLPILWLKTVSYSHMSKVSGGDKFSFGSVRLHPR